MLSVGFSTSDCLWFSWIWDLECRAPVISLDIVLLLSISCDVIISAVPELKLFVDCEPLSFGWEVMFCIDSVLELGPRSSWDSDSSSLENLASLSPSSSSVLLSSVSSLSVDCEPIRLGQGVICCLDPELGIGCLIIGRMKTSN